MTIISLRKGARVQYSGQTMKVAGVHDLHSVILESEQGQFLTAQISDLAAEAKAKAPATVPVDFVRLQKVDKYRAVFGPLLAQPRTTRAQVERAGKALGIGCSAAYEAIARFRGSGDINDLPPPTRPGGKNKSRLDPAAEKIIKDQIKTVLLHGRRKYSPRKFYKDTKKLLEKNGHKVCATTLRNRVASPHFSPS
jgi:hypothetical protein